MHVFVRILVVSVCLFFRMCVWNKSKSRIQQRVRENWMQFANCMLSTLFIQINILSRFPINTKFSIRFPTRLVSHKRWVRERTNELESVKGIIFNRIITRKVSCKRDSILFALPQFDGRRGEITQVSVLGSVLFSSRQSIELSYFAYNTKKISKAKHYLHNGAWHPYTWMNETRRVNITLHWILEELFGLD